MLCGVDITNKQFKTKNGTTYPSNWVAINKNRLNVLKSLDIIVLDEVYPPITSGETYNGYVDHIIIGTTTGSTRVYNVQTKSNYELNIPINYKLFLLKQDLLLLAADVAVGIDGANDKYLALRTQISDLESQLRSVTGSTY